MGTGIVVSGACAQSAQQVNIAAKHGGHAAVRYKPVVLVPIRGVKKCDF